MKKLALLLTLLMIIPSFSAIGAEKTNDFSFVDLKGKTHKFSEYKGKWVLVNYWASYCPPCLAEMPDIENFYRDNKNKFTVLGMDMGGSQVVDIEAFMRDYGITYPLIPMQDSTQQAFGPIIGIPTSFIISPQGEIVEKYVGVITYDDLNHHVNPKKQVSKK